MSAHAPEICDSSVNRLRMLHFNRQIHTCYHNIFFLLNKICDGGSSKEPFLKVTTLSILIWAYPREMRTSNGNFKNAAILPSKIAHARRACALILPLCLTCVVASSACATRKPLSKGDSCLRCSFSPATSLVFTGLLRTTRSIFMSVFPLFISSEYNLTGILLRLK